MSELCGETTRVRLCGVDDIAVGAVQLVEIGSHRIAVVRLADGFHALGDRCSHANYSLSAGEVHETERSLECPKHGSCFSLDTGEPDSLPAIRPVPLYPVEVDGPDVYIMIP